MYGATVNHTWMREIETDLRKLSSIRAKRSRDSWTDEILMPCRLIRSNGMRGTVEFDDGLILSHELTDLAEWNNIGAA